MCTNVGLTPANPEISDDAALQSLGEKLPRLHSTSGRHNRFRVEKLFNVRCTLVADEANAGESLLKLATDNVYVNEDGEESACLWMSVGFDRYSMIIRDTTAEKALLYESVHETKSNVLVFAIVTDTEEQGIAAITHIKRMFDGMWKPRVPVVLVGYKTNAARGRDTDDRLVKKLAALSREINAYRCLDCSAINRSTLRTILAMALLAARPYILKYRTLNELKFDDDLPSYETGSLDRSLPNTSSVQGTKLNRSLRSKKQRIARIFTHKHSFSDMCRMQ